MAVHIQAGGIAWPQGLLNQGGSMITNTNNVVRYLLSGTSYAITYGYWATSEIEVYLTEADGSLTALTYGTDFSLTTPNGASGTLTLIKDPGTATKITILRSVDLTQETDLVNGETMDAETIERAFDHAVAAIQQVDEKTVRSIKTPVDEAGGDITIPAKDARKGTNGKGTIFGFGPDGTTGIVRDLAEFDEDVEETAQNAAAAKASEEQAGIYLQETARERAGIETYTTYAQRAAQQAADAANETLMKAEIAAAAEESALDSAGKAKTSKEEAAASEQAALEYKNAADESKQKAKASEDNAKESEDAAAEILKETAQQRAGIETYATYAMIAAQQAKDAALAALADAEAAEAARLQTSEDREDARLSKEAAAASETNAGLSKVAAKASEDAAAASKDDAVAARNVAVEAKNTAIDYKNQTDGIRNATEVIRQAVVALFNQIIEASAQTVTPITVVDGVAYYKSEFSINGRPYTEYTLVE